MPVISQTFSAAELQRYHGVGRYLSIRKGVDLSVRFFRENRFIGEFFLSVNAGFFYDAGNDKADWFDAFELSSPSLQTVEVFSSTARIGEPQTVSVVGEVATYGASGSATITASGLVSTTSISILPSRPRRFLSIQNTSGGIGILRFGSTTSPSFQLNSLASLTFDSFVPSDEVFAASSSGINQFSIIEAL